MEIKIGKNKIWITYQEKDGVSKNGIFDEIKNVTIEAKDGMLKIHQKGVLKTVKKIKDGITINDTVITKGNFADVMKMIVENDGEAIKPPEFVDIDSYIARSNDYTGSVNSNNLYYNQLRASVIDGVLTVKICDRNGNVFAQRAAVLGSAVAHLIYSFYTSSSSSLIAVYGFNLLQNVDSFFDVRPNILENNQYSNYYSSIALSSVEIAKKPNVKDVPEMVIGEYFFGKNPNGGGSNFEFSKPVGIIDIAV